MNGENLDQFQWSSHLEFSAIRHFNPLFLYYIQFTVILFLLTTNTTIRRPHTRVSTLLNDERSSDKILSGSLRVVDKTASGNFLSIALHSRLVAEFIS